MCAAGVPKTNPFVRTDTDEDGRLDEGVVSRGKTLCRTSHLSEGVVGVGRGGRTRRPVVRFGQCLRVFYQTTVLFSPAISLDKGFLRHTYTSKKRFVCNTKESERKAIISLCGVFWGRLLFFVIWVVLIGVPSLQCVGFLDKNF